MRGVLTQMRVRLRVWRARRAMSPAAWAEHRRAIEAASRFDDAREIERQCDEVRRLVERLELAASVGSQEARHRLKRLRLNPIGAEAARVAGEALARLDAAMMAGARND